MNMNDFDEAVNAQMDALKKDMSKGAKSNLFMFGSAIDMKLTKVMDGLAFEDALPILKRHKHKFMLVLADSLNNALHYVYVLNDHKEFLTFQAIKVVDSYSVAPAIGTGELRMVLADNWMLFKLPKDLDQYAAEHHPSFAPQTNQGWQQQGY